EILRDKHFPLNDAWIEQKKDFSQGIVSILESRISKQDKILSVGCGLGIVEIPLIESGYKVDLQECQNISIDYLKINFKDKFDKINFILSEDLSNIMSDTYS